MQILSNLNKWTGQSTKIGHKLQGFKGRQRKFLAAHNKTQCWNFKLANSFTTKQMKKSTCACRDPTEALAIAIA